MYLLFLNFYHLADLIDAFVTKEKVEEHTKRNLFTFSFTIDVSSARSVFGSGHLNNGIGPKDGKLSFSHTSLFERS
jgi:hypothetical protein